MSDFTPHSHNLFHKSWPTYVCMVLTFPFFIPAGGRPRVRGN